MALIRIEERTRTRQGTQAVVSFNHGSQYPVTITDPFSEQQEQALSWYFEEHLRLPFLEPKRAEQAATSIKAYGEALFGQLFRANPDVYATYKKHADAGLEKLHFEIAGSPAFHALHWEALKDPNVPHPFALDATLVRKNLTPVPFEATLETAPVLRVLVVTARPDGKRDVGYRTISRPLVETLRQANLRVQIDLLRPGTYETLEQTLRAATDQHGKGYYQVIHFDLHGAVLTYDQLNKGREANRLLFQHRPGFDRPDIAPYSGERAFLFLETERTGQSDPVEASELAQLLLAHQVPVALLNACQSGKTPLIAEKQEGNETQAREASQEQAPTILGDQRESSLAFHLMRAGIQVVLAMGYSVTVSAAALLMQAFYRQLFSGGDLPIALRSARVALAGHKARQAAFQMSIDLEDWLLPVLCQNEVVRLSTRALTPEEDRQFHEQQAARYREPQTTYGFFGRDLDVLEIERRLLLPREGEARNVLLVRGMGGVGKTTLLSHLAAWWQTTHLVERVFVFAYNERAWSRQQVVRAMAEQIVGKEGYKREYQHLSVEAQQEKLTALLRATRHLLILDNLELITGTHFAIRHTLSSTEQKALRSFLADLAGGKTLVLLGSRGEEAWLASGTFESNRYELAGLDEEAASQLAERILARHQATRYRDSEDLRRLLKLLDGFPLALEVVLANLARQAPAEILSALHAGDISLDAPGKTDKTTSILQCIDYSHSNLSAEAQNLSPLPRAFHHNIRCWRARQLHRAAKSTGRAGRFAV